MAMDTLSISDVMALQNKDDNGGAMGGGMWIFFLFILLLFSGGGGGFGGLGGAANSSTNFINNDFLYTNLKNTIDQGFGQVVNSNFALQRDVFQGFATQSQQMASCCCETNRNIDSVRYENAKNTCDIIQSGNANTQRIIDHMTQSEIQTLRDQLQSANLTLANQVQTNNIISAVRPCPVPSYPVCSPYTAYNGQGCC